MCASQLEINICSEQHKNLSLVWALKFMINYRKSRRRSSENRYHTILRKSQLLLHPQVRVTFNFLRCSIGLIVIGACDYCNIIIVKTRYPRLHALHCVSRESDSLSIRVRTSLYAYLIPPAKKSTSLSAISARSV